MTPQLLVLLAASLCAVQIASLVLKREHADEAPYLALLAADLALLIWVNVTGRHDTMLAFIGEGIAGILTLAPRFLDGLERGALLRDRFDRAARVAMVRELLTPGRTATRRRRQLADLAQTRAGGGLAVARRLRAELAEAKDPARALALREELATVLFFDRRFAEGVEEIECHLDPAELTRRPAFAAYLVRAYGELGRLDRAAEILSRLEDGLAARDPTVAPLLVQARLSFLAFAGQPVHVELLLATPPGLFLPDRAKEFLLDTARARAGRPLDPDVARLAEAIAARAVVPVGAQRPRGRAPVTRALVAANVLLFAIVIALSAKLGASLQEFDGAILVRAGGLFRPAVYAGEWWRLGTAMFLHGNFWHFAFNLYALYLLGRFTEDIFGPARYLALYLCAGLAGAAASTLVGAGALSVGASGAIMGLLGALIVTLVLRRGHWPEAWRRVLLWNLILVGALQIYIGFEVAMIDNAAHVGGMLGGAVGAIVFAPGALLGAGKRGTRIAGVVAGALSALLVAGAALTVATPLPRTLERLPTRTVEVGGVKLTVPAYWELDAQHGTVIDPYLEVTLQPKLTDGQVRIETNRAEDPRFRPLLERIGKSAR